MSQTPAARTGAEAPTSAQEALIRFEANEERLNTFVNATGTYTADTDPPREVQTLPSYMAELRGRYLNVVMRGDWQADAAYAMNDLARRPDGFYLAVAAHTSSSSFAADLAARLWVAYASDLLVHTATESVSGIAFAATETEAAQGLTDASRQTARAFITPETLALGVAFRLPVQATATRAGVAMLATPDDFPGDTALEDIDNSKIVTPRLLAYYGGVPSGGIIMWSGAATDIPAGWTLCDGENNAPDLRGRFIVGAGGIYETAETGGNEMHEHALSIGGTTLTTGQIPSHGHTLFGFSSAMGNSAWGYSPDGLRTDTVSTGSTGGNGSHAHTGAAQPSSSIPPYYALCFIMKL